jgi:ankyrin repeat protein
MKPNELSWHRIQEVLQIESESVPESADLEKTARNARKFWHPDKAVGSQLNQDEVEKFKINFQLIPVALERFQELILKKQQEIELQNNARRHYFNAADDPVFLLFRAIKFNRLDLIDKLLSVKTNPNSVFKKHTLLMHAARLGRTDAARLLIQFGAQVDYIYLNQTALLCAIDANQTEMTFLLLEEGANPTLKTRNGWTVLMRSINTKNPQIVQALLDNGAEINARTNGGWTALMQAVDKDSVELVELLLKQGANRYEESRNGKSALKMASMKSSKEMLSLFKNCF